jgi:carbamoyl-phosphate synthase large subunit
VALINAFGAALRELGLRGQLMVADSDSATAAFHRADKAFITPPVDTVKYMPALLDICRQNKIALLAPMTDLDLRSLSRQTEAFREIGCTVMIGSPASVLTCRDKARSAAFFERIGLGLIRTLSLEEFRKKPFYPCFIKPIRGSAGIGTALLPDERALRNHVEAHGELMLVQDYVPGAEYTLDIYRSRDGKVHCVVPRQRLAVRSGEVEKAVTVHDEELIATGVLLGEKLEGIWGVLNAQCRRPAGGKAHVFEVNPRFGGGAPLSIAAGANLPRYVLEETLGLPLSAKLGRFTPNLLMLRYDEALYVPVDDPSRLPGYDSPRMR